MALEMRHLYASVRIIGDDPPASTVSKRAVIGTGFFLRVPSDHREGVTHAYLITAAHVLKNQPKIEVQVPNPLGGLYPTVTVSKWIYPLDGVDIALAPWPTPSDAMPMFGLELDMHLVPSDRVPSLFLGSKVFYVGFLMPWAIPMVRAGTIGALDADIPFKEGYRYPCHLVDCRSYDGFSGSPCYMERDYANLTPLDESRLPSATEAPPGRLGNVTNFVALAGMFTAHLTEGFDGDDGAVNRHGVGAMLRGQEIREALMSPKARKDRERREDENPEDDLKFSGAKRSTSRKRDMDERVSLDPLEFEDAVKGMLEAKPPPD